MTQINIEEIAKKAYAAAKEAIDKATAEFIKEDESKKEEKGSFKERRIKEQLELKDRIVKLINFLYSPESYIILDETERKAMTSQLSSMLNYLHYLTLRIAYSEAKARSNKNISKVK